MERLTIQLDGLQPGSLPMYKPGGTIAGSIAWQIEPSITALELRLFWYTQSVIQRRVQIVEIMRVDSPAAAGTRAFRFELPDSPYSFAGKLFTVKWSLELACEPGGQASGVEFVLGPQAQPIDVRAAAD